MRPRLKAEIKSRGVVYLNTSETPERYRTRSEWWVRVTYQSNGKIHSHTENYNTKRAALNALRALGDGVEIVEP